MSDNTEQTPKKQVKWLNIGIFFSTFAAVVFVVAFSYGYFELSKVNMSLANTVTALQQRATDTQGQVAKLESKLGDLKQVLANSQTLSQQQEQMISDWKASQQGNLAKWYVAEAKYLTSLANDHVLYTHNTSMALTLLQRAAQVLATLNDNALLPIRKSIANDIAQLQSAPKIDTTQLYLVLTALNAQLDKLPLPAGPMQKLDKPSLTRPDNTGLSWWRTGLNNTWHALQKIVIVRRNESSMPPLVMPDEKAFLYLNLHAQMETATWGALHGNWTIYQSGLALTSKWIKQYFVLNSPETLAVLNHIKGLQNVNVQPPKVNLTPTLQLFEDYLAQSGQQVVMNS